MLRTIHRIRQLVALPAYREAVARTLPADLAHDPGPEAALAGYDFHLTRDIPQLIEVNSNAGGSWLAWQAQHGPAAPAGGTSARRKLLQGFLDEFAHASALAGRPLGRAVILDESPESQFLFGEMNALREEWQAAGVDAVVADPSALRMDESGVYLADGCRVDLVYNRHCDFLLETPALAGLRAAYRAGSVCLTPNPWGFALLSDKRRLILWSDEAALRGLGLPPEAAAGLAAAVPQTREVGSLPADRLWSERARWVFKPPSGYASRGVLLGDSITRTRFNALPPDTLAQRFHAPSQVDAEGGPMKTDWRIFACRQRILGVGARLYRGQVTSLRQPGTGYAKIRLTDD
ncbi:MAG: hypothetical protein HQL51_04410 [Magnetococcales bacterium]|nr:hypothetical protein [Magnetococcales bacterium]